MRGALMHVLILKLKCQFVIALLLILAAKLLLAIALVIHLRSLLLSLTPARNTTSSLSAALRDKCPPSSACMHIQAGAPLVLSLVTKLLLASDLIIHLRALLLSLTPARNVTCAFLLY